MMGALHQHPAASAPMSEGDARDRTAALIDNVNTLLRTIWENVEAISLPAGSAGELAWHDAMVSLSMAQEYGAELKRLDDRPVR